MGVIISGWGALKVRLHTIEDFGRRITLPEARIIIAGKALPEYEHEYQYTMQEG